MHEDVRIDTIDDFAVPLTVKRTAVVPYHHLIFASSESPSDREKRVFISARVSVIYQVVGIWPL